MKNGFLISLLIIVIATSAVIEPLKKSDVERFKQLVSSDKKYVAICDLYYTVQLAKELKVATPKLTCDEIPVNESTVEDAYYSYSMLKEYNCKPSLPKNLDSVISEVNSLEDTFYAIQFPNVKFDANKLAPIVYEKISQCATVSCKTLTLSEKAAAFSILFRIYPSLTAANKAAMKTYTAMSANLLQELETKSFISAEKYAFFSIADLTMVAISSPSLSEESTQSITKYFTSFHSTYQSCYAFTLLRVLPMLKNQIGNNMISISGTYKNNQVALNVVNVVDEPVSDLTVEIQVEDEEKQIASFKNGNYIASCKLADGFNDINVIIRNNEGNTLFDDKMTILAPVAFSVKQFNININKNQQTYEINDEPAIEVTSKSQVQISIKMESDNDITPSTALIMIENKEGKKISLPLVKHDKELTLSFVPSRRDIALPFNYEHGEFTFYFLCGDVLLEQPIKLVLAHITMNFGDIPAKPIYPLYTKPLMYESENSLEPLKEIEHIFSPDVKNPIFPIPLSFCAAIILLILVLIILWKKIGITWKKENTIKQVSKFIFFGCVVTITSLYIVFWIGWNMIDMLKVLIPLALVTVLVGNHAL